MRLQLFNGGKASRKAPHLIASNQGVEYLNIDNSAGPLQPVKSEAASGILVDQYATFFEAKQQWVAASTNRDYVEFQEKLYWTDGIGKPQKYDGVNQYQLGIDAPTAKPTYSSVVNQPPAITRAKFTESTAAGNLPGNSQLTYLLVNIDNATGFESEGFFVLVNTGSGSTHQITVTDLDTNFKDAVKLYRLFDGTYRLLHTFTSPTDSYTDSVFDISGNAALTTTTGALNGTIQYVYTYYNSAEGVESAPSPASVEQEVSKGKIVLQNLVASSDPQVDKKRIYRIGGGLSAFSLVDEIDNAVTTFEDNIADDAIDGAVLSSEEYFPPPAGLQYLTEANASLFGAKGQKLYYSEVGLPNAWPSTNFIDFPADITGLGDTASGLLVFTRYKAYIVTGTSPATYSKYLLSGDQGCISHKSVAQYKSMVLWASTDGICASSGNEPEVITKETLGKLSLSPVSAVVHDEVYYLGQPDRILALDFRYSEKIAKEFDLGFSTLITANDKLYGWKDGQLYELFAGSDYKTFTFISGDVVEGEYSNLKTYNELFVRYNGNIVLEVFIDGVSVLTKALTGDKPTAQIKVPQARQQGYKISFKITGTGTVYELIMNPMGRQK